MGPRLLRWASTVFLGSWGVGFICLTAWLRWVPPKAPPLATPEVEPVEPRPWFAIPDRVHRGETLATVLYRNGFSPREVHHLAEAVSPYLNVRHLRPGDEVEVRYRPEGTVQSVLIYRGALDIYEVRRAGPDEWAAHPLSVVLERRLEAAHGTLEGSLFASMEAMGEGPALVIRFAGIFAWDFDFYTQSRPGDRFSVLVEKLYRDHEFVGYGELLAARYVSGDTDLSAFLYEDPEGKKGYFDPEGKSMRKAFLKAPLKFQRVSSRFSYGRLHPIHHRRMPHLGVDYAAPTGTPVYSVADGTVVGISRKAWGGNVVAVRHGMGYQSKYLHLSRFARGVRVGKRVKQKEVIGYVGSTGAATGPHLDFRLSRYGNPVNPLKQIFPPGPPVDEAYLSDFLEKRDSLARQLEPGAVSPRGARRTAEE